MASTIGPIEAGIVPLLEDRFEAETGIRVRHVGAGTGEALEIAQGGSVDLVLVHAKALEDRFVEDGYGTERIPLMYNDFVIVGPTADPAGVRRLGSATEALRTIAGRRAPFVSRGDRSGTHVAELELWSKAGLKPAGPWYVVYERGSEGNAATLRFADERQAYIVIDRATWLSLADRSRLAVLLENDEALLNFITLIPVNPRAGPGGRARRRHALRAMAHRARQGSEDRRGLRRRAVRRADVLPELARVDGGAREANAMNTSNHGAPMPLTLVSTRRCAALLATVLAAAASPGVALAVAPGEPPPRAGAAESLPQPPSPSAPPRWPRALRVVGEGRAHAVPDVAIVTVGVVATDPSLAKATRDADARARKVQAVVAAAGVAAADVQTSRYDVDIERRADRPDEEPRVVGYRVVNELRVKVRDLAALGGLLDRVVAAGANEVQGLQFAKEDTTAEQGRALAAAVRAAHAKAEEMARAAGLRLGELVELSEGVRASPGPIVPMRAMSAAKSSGVAVQSGEIELEAQVEAVFALP